MDEYIKKSDAVFCACKVLDKFGGCTMGAFCPDSGCREVREEFDKLPAADVKPVVHGKWTNKEWEGFNGNFSAECDQCGKRTLAYFHCNFCPFCGADMREK